LWSFSFFFSCGKLELPDTDKEQTSGGGGSGTSKPDTVVDDGKEEFIGEIPVFTVGQALKAASGTYAYVKGYVVGGVLSNSYIFGTNFERANTALLLADSPDEKDKKKTFAVALRKDEEGLRDALNLYDHPEWLGRKIRICGEITKYYSRMGCSEPEGDYAWLQETSEGGSGSGGNDDDSPDDAPQGGGSQGGGSQEGEENKPVEPMLPELKDSVGHVESGR